jgi:hypothetical protein
MRLERFAVDNDLPSSHYILGVSGGYWASSTHKAKRSCLMKETDDGKRHYYKS